MTNEKYLSNKIILITGGTSELGRQFVQKALFAGARVYFTSFQDRETFQALESAGAAGFVLDLADMRAIDNFVKTFKEKERTLDILIHNAAAVRDHTLQNLTEEEWDYVMTVNLKAPYYLTKKLMPLLFKQSSTCHREESRPQGAASPRDDVAISNSGRATKKIFMMTSRAAVMGGFGVSNYAAAKAGLIGLTKSLAQELGKKNILTNAVNPGFMKSKMTRDLPPEVIRRNREASPLGKCSDPAEVADFLVFLCSDQMTQVTGQVFHFESRNPG